MTKMALLVATLACGLPWIVLGTPSAFADIAGPLQTKEEACVAPNSYNRLAITWNGEAREIFYYEKIGNALYYVVPASIRGRWYDRYWGAMFLYRYDCASKKSSLVVNANLKKYVDPKDLTGGGVYGPTRGWGTVRDVRELDYGQVSLENGKFIITLWILQTGISVNLSYDPSTGTFASIRPDVPDYSSD